MQFKMEATVDALVQCTQGSLPEVALTPGFLNASFPLLSKASDLLNREVAQRFGLAVPWTMMPTSTPGMVADLR
ncbi:hypothetical protein HaLaN_06988, partial [Haematococcus lacustris]